MAEPVYWNEYPSLHPFADEIGVIDPRDGSFVGSLPVTDHGHIAMLGQSAREALPAWRALSTAERCAYLERIARLLEEEEQRFGELAERETGRPAVDGIEGVRAGVATLRQYAQHAPLHRGHSLLGGASALDFDRREPRGVAALLTPWNDPIAVACGLIGAALAVGNTVLYKPSEHCPHTGTLLGHVAGEILPPDVLATVIGGPATGEEMLEWADVVAHVGSTAGGERIARIAALTGAHVIRENSGNDPLIVDAGVDPLWAAGQAGEGAFTNTGQLCTSVERIYVLDEIAEDFTAALVWTAERLNEAHSLGPLVDQALREHVHHHVRAAVEAGASALTGGMLPDGAGFYYPATVLTGCSDEMQVAREESFGPLAPIIVVSSFAEAVDRAASDPFGLAATVLTSDLSHAIDGIEHLKAGTVKVNGVFGGAPGGSAQPRGASGSGFGYGPELLDEFSFVKVVHIEGAPQRGTVAGEPLAGTRPADVER
jgi:acyl-CoA reductase-like NAD-dependent aldehyde dehydrogenase